MNINQLATGIANYLSRELALDTTKIDTIRFGLEIIFAALIKGIILISLAHFLGILPEVVFAMVCGAIYRLLSGGAHCDGYWRCLTLGVLTYLGAGELGIYLGPYLSTDLLVYALLTGYLLFFVCVLIWVPGEVPYKKFTSISERSMFKILSLIYLSLWLGVSIIVMHYVNPSLALAGLVAVIIQTISYSPPGYKIIFLLDNLLAGLFKERRCPVNETEH
ncbi:accessory gene regulator B [Desulfotomaculum arcticum]|uniref:Accessory gene regulator B n=1 Tax=Desulfotruncus arcticus DSM 17038 TaxID=1121424 RepID=A0A1I2Q2L8_9FIRM|nr:accessory gene regulator B family protein [Desulfotruncus arcticus]SFG22140.1 accessory gene regulator B [Desulfotomaculum arcticum] [Desulfotruncus arcticus DSM 17038]